MASPNLSEIVTTTLRNRSKNVRDAVSINSVLQHRLTEKGKKRTFSGGRTIVEEIEYAENSTYIRYAGPEQLTIQPSDIITAGEYSIKQAAMSFMITGLEELQNAGKEQIIDLMETRMSNTEKSFVNNLTRDMYSDGTAAGGRQIGGLRLGISDTGLGTVGGIDATTWAWWRNQVESFAAAGLPATAANIQTLMNRLYVRLIRNKDQTDLIVADNNYYLLYLSSLQAIQRITNDKLASAGFQNLKFMGADVVLDGGLNGAAPGSHMYFLNTDYIHWRPHAKRDMVPLGGDRQAMNQDAVAKIMAWAGNLTYSNRMLQGVLTA
jgi:hypothetical protein